jgi:hypothetical protein
MEPTPVRRIHVEQENLDYSGRVGGVLVYLYGVVDRAVYDRHTGGEHDA